MRKLGILILLFAASGASRAVDVIPYATTQEAAEQGVIETLTEVAQSASDEIKRLYMMVPDQNFRQFKFGYVDKLAKGTVSKWQLIKIGPKGERTVVASWNSRNGTKSIPPEHSTKIPGTDAELFARAGGDGRPRGRQIVGNSDKNWNDAEVKAFDRSVLVRQELGLRPSEVELVGMVDKPMCDSCALNANDAELAAGTPFADATNEVGSPKAAGKIKIMHLTGDAQAEFAKTRKGIVAKDLLPLAEVCPGAGV